MSCCFFFFYLNEIILWTEQIKRKLDDSNHWLIESYSSALFTISAVQSSVISFWALKLPSNSWFIKCSCTFVRHLFKVEQKQKHCIHIIRLEDVKNVINSYLCSNLLIGDDAIVYAVLLKTKSFSFTVAGCSFENSWW